MWWFLREHWKDLIFLTLPLWVEPLAMCFRYHSWAVLSYAGMCLLCTRMIFVLGGLIAVLALPIGLLMTVGRQYRARAGLAIAQSAVFLASFIGGLLLGQLVWRAGVENVVDRSQRLIFAIHQFVAEELRLPRSLDELTPRYLREIPTTGIGSSPQFRYIVGRPDDFDNNPWVLIVSTGSPPMGFDQMLFFPLQNYPERGYGGSMELIGNWGYVRD